MFCVDYNKINAISVIDNQFRRRRFWPVMANINLPQALFTRMKRSLVQGLPHVIRCKYEILVYSVVTGLVTAWSISLSLSFFLFFFFLFSSFSVYLLIMFNSFIRRALVMFNSIMFLKFYTRLLPGAYVGFLLSSLDGNYEMKYNLW